ncbi:MAG: helix-turn-helix domain-containing protein [Gammaproteobacteria bacterium]|nr:helix-turn-helix domain-containing protein [Gammaproteobacteria bacterium]
MKDFTLRKLSENLEKTMSSKKIDAKELAKISGVGYSSLTPILNGSRDFGVSKLIAIANALGCGADELLNGLISKKKEDPNSISTPKYIAVFISVIAVTYGILYEIESNNKITSVLPFPLRCGQEPNELLDHMVTSIQKLAKEVTTKIDNGDIAVFVSVQQYGRATNRKKIQQKGDKVFAKFVMEADSMANHKALLSKKNGICISINDGNIITYSNDSGKTVNKLQGYGFPTSDVAGNYWLGCEAIKYAIKVKDGLDESSLLSDKVLALFNDDVVLLQESIAEKPEATYLKASQIVKELTYEQEQSRIIIQKSADLLMESIRVIDRKTKTKLPIVITGDLAYLYNKFLPSVRITTHKSRHSTILLNYGLAVMNRIKP